MQIHTAMGTNLVFSLTTRPGKPAPPVEDRLPKPSPRFGSGDLGGQMILWSGIAILFGIAMYGTLRQALTAKRPEPGEDHPDVREARALAEEARMREIEASQKANDKPDFNPPTGL